MTSFFNIFQIFRKLPIKHYLLLLIVVFASYGQTLQMYFLIDDNALIYKLQHLDENIGLWGGGIFGEGPYKHIVDQFILFYPLFTTFPVFYYGVGVFLYFLASVAVYFFARNLSKNTTVAVLSSLIFASGFVGSETMFGITNSWQTMRGIISALFSLIFLNYFFKTKKFKYYFLALVIFFLTLETVYIRSPGLVFGVIVFDLLFSGIEMNWKSIRLFLMRQIPFILIYLYVYFLDAFYIKGFGLLNLINDIFIEKKYHLTGVFFQDLGNLFIPNTLSIYVDRIFPEISRRYPGVFIGSLTSGLTLLGAMVFIVKRYRSKNPLLVKLALFSLAWMIVNFIVFYAKENSTSFWSSHRYFSFSFVGVSIFWSVMFYLISQEFHRYKKVMLILPFCLVFGMYFVLNIKYQNDFNQKRSFYAKKFFEDFRKALPVIKKGDVIYIDVANSAGIRNRYSSFFGGMFSKGANFAIYTPGINYMKDFKMVDDFETLQDLKNKGLLKPENLYAFYYDGSNLQDTSSNLRALLFGLRRVFDIDLKHISSNLDFKVEDGEFDTKASEIGKDAHFRGYNPSITVTLPDNIPSLVPGCLIFEMRAIPKEVGLPYRSNDSIDPIIPSERRDLILDYLVSRKKIRRGSIITTKSVWKKQLPGLLLDGRLDTSWRGDREFWYKSTHGEVEDKEFIEIDLNGVLDVGALKWVSSQKVTLPVEYQLFLSLDGKRWEMVKDVKRIGSLTEGSIVLDEISPRKARYVRMVFNRTYGNDSPEIKEIEVVEERFKNLNDLETVRMEKDPFDGLGSMRDLEVVEKYISSNAVMVFWWMSSADERPGSSKYRNLEVKADGLFNSYRLKLPAEGVYWKQFGFKEFNFPANLGIKNMRIEYNTSCEANESS